MPSKTKNLPAGTTIVSIQIPQSLHEAMKQIRQVRWQQEGIDPKLSRMYREAVEQYVTGKPQQKLLEEFRGEPRTVKSAAAKGRV